jgi:predicted CoA-binding protein
MPLSPEAFEDAVRSARVVGVLGANVDPARPAHYVPAALKRAGVRIVPVNPAFAGQQVHGAEILSGLDQLHEVVDILDVFRLPSALPAHLPEILAMTHRPRLVWFQSGIRNDVVAKALEEAGIPVVQDRCLMIDHRAFA